MPIIIPPTGLIGRSRFPVIRSHSVPDLLDDLRKGIYCIPDFQRNMVWEAEDVLALLISIYDGLSIGLPLVMEPAWRHADTETSKPKTRDLEPVAYYKKVKGLPAVSPARSSDLIVIDGQQRLSAIFYMFFCEDLAKPPSSVQVHDKMQDVFFIKVDPTQICSGSGDSSTSLAGDELFEAVNAERGTSKEYLARKDTYLTTQEIYEIYCKSGGFYTTLQNEVKVALSAKKGWKGVSSDCIERAAQLLTSIAQRLFEYVVNIVEYKGVSFDSMVMTFTKVNKHGVKLGIFDMAVATFYEYINLREKVDEWADKLRSVLSGPSFIKSMVDEIYAVQNPGSGVSSVSGDDKREDLLRVMAFIVDASIKEGRILQEIGRFISRINPSSPPQTIASPPQTIGGCNITSAEQIWDYACVAYQAALERLEERYGVREIGYLPSSSMVPVLAALLHAAAAKRSSCSPNLLPPFPGGYDYYFEPNQSSNPYKSLPPDVENMIDCWYWVSIFAQRYSRSVQTTSETDVRQFTKWLDNPSSTPNFCRIGEIKLSLRKAKKSEAVYKGVICLIFKSILKRGGGSSVRTWFHGVIPPSQFEADHIFPKGSSKRPSPWASHAYINSILNITVLTRADNRTKGNRFPSDVYRDMRSKHGSLTDDILGDHLISGGAITAFRADDFEQFIEARENIIADEIRKVINDACCGNCASPQIQVVREESNGKEKQKERVE